MEQLKNLPMLVHEYANKRTQALLAAQVVREGKRERKRKKRKEKHLSI
jgi:hypothetical protein